MIVAVDIGNTSITLGVLSGLEIIDRHFFDVHKTNPDVKVQLDRFCRRIKLQKMVIGRIIICSVVPQKTKVVAGTLQTQLGLKPEAVGTTVKVPIKNNYRVPRQVGQDRLVGAYAVKELYGYPAIIIDFGTAITFDVVNAKGQYNGGLIVPGIRLTTEALFKKTAMLPNVSSIVPPKNLVGKDTTDSILSGIFNGYGAMCHGLIESISATIKGRPKVIVTGGYTNMMKRYIHKKIDCIDRDLVLKGLSLLAKEN